MDWKINKIILWPKNPQFERKEIDFDLHKTNIIVGDSQTGKSSIIPIIDYCLCSSKCTIPVGPIRKATAWFGILVVHGDTQLLLAREEPGNRQSTNQMFFDEGSNLKLPDVIKGSNRSSDQVINRLNQLSNLPSLDFSDGTSERKPYENRPSFKDFLAFCFQSQHIIANPHTLFYQADTIEHKLKLRTVFPLALGLIQTDTLEFQRRLSVLYESLREKQAVLEQKRKIRDAWEAEIKGNYIKALEFGILKDTPFPEDSWKLEDYVGYLSRVPEIAKTLKYPTLSEGLSARIATYTTKIQKHEDDILTKLEEKSYRLALLKNFKNTSTEYELAIHHQRARLEPVNKGWLSSKLKKITECPICGSENVSAKEDVRHLINTAESIREKVAQITDSKNVLDKEVTEIEKEILELEKQLNSVRIQLEGLGRQHDQIERQRKSLEEIFRYVGRIEQNLQNLNQTAIESTLFQSIAKLQDEIHSIEQELKKTNNSQSREAIMKRISVAINFYKQILKVEDADNPTEIDEKQLTLKITSPDNRDDYLWEIGSGSNWMGYHVSTTLALQEYFLTLKSKNYVPSFVVFDQPSQAYFPETYKDKKGIQQLRRSDDLERVQGIFFAFSNFINRTQSGCQVIVLEHAGPEFWADQVDGFYVGGRRWDRDNALIPKEWIAAI